MKIRYLLLPLAALLTVIPARSCGPDFASAVFVTPNGPSGAYTAFAAGHLGVPQRGYRTRSLAVAYDWLSHRPLSAAEQREAVAANDYFAQTDTGAPPKSVTSAVEHWYKARETVGPPVSVTTPLPPSWRSVPDEAYQNFDNCLADAYTTAVRTLHARVASYGATNPEVSAWAVAQDAVFSNCAGSGIAPQPVTTGSLWLRQDRAYQIAAARFYAMDYAGALTAFRAIAADTASPWSTLSRYLEARTLIRQASMPTLPSVSGGTPAAQASAATQATRTLAQARTELLAMREEPRMSSMRGAIDDLLDIIDFQLQPEHQAVVLAARLRGPHPRNFQQTLIDLSLIRANNYADNELPLFNTEHRTPAEREKIRAAARASQREAADMLDWMDAINGASSVKPLARWQQNHGTPWLLAAMIGAQPGDASLAELLDAARKIPPNDPGYVAVTYHRLRLSPRNAATREELLAVLPAVEKSADTSTSNLFKSLNAYTAPTLDAWLAAAARPLAGESDDLDRGRGIGDELDPCGNGKIRARQRRLFDADAAFALNTKFPLRIFAEAATSSALPRNLRFQVAQAAWARAVILDRPEIAAKMSPLLIACRAAWKPVLDAYDHAATAADRRAEGLLALMRFASTEPSVREGESRRNGFAAYDDYRQNWWCTTVPLPGQSVDDDFPQPRAALSPSAPLATPVFLSAAELAEAAAEVTALRKVPSASTYFAQQALAWWKLHSGDPRNPDLLGEADRALRNSCRTDPPEDPKTRKPLLDPHDMTLTPNLAKALFEVLHTSYPRSPWAKRYKTWE